MRLPDDIRARLKEAVLASNDREHGWQGPTIFEQAIVIEQRGEAASGLPGAAWQSALLLKNGTDEQRRRYRLASCRGDRICSFAISEVPGPIGGRSAPLQPAATGTISRERGGC
jgi:alkylation response protein AidB-like acyl-CoA dehydrogenase